MGVSARQDDVLKVVHPGRHVEFFREPITAGEIMSRYPRHCLARPDFFEYPWIVVHPNSLLFPGKVFYLVPYRTIYKRLKAKMEYQQQQESDGDSKSYQYPKHQQQRINNNKQSHHTVNYDRELYVCTPEQIPDTTKSLDKSSFYRLWNNMKRNLHQPMESGDYLNYGLYSPFSVIRSGEGLVTCPEHAGTLKSCLKKSDSARKELKFKVYFASPVSSFEQDARVNQVR